MTTQKKPAVAQVAEMAALLEQLERMGHHDDVVRLVLQAQQLLALRIREDAMLERLDLLRAKL